MTFFRIIFLLLLSANALAAIKFPALTGRVVDNANLLSPQTERTLTQKLSGYEQSTTNQIVVVTLTSLQGYTIEDFGYQLGREWGIGQKAKNNGVLLIVAPNERKVRIEVGYGLEGVLTDAYSHNIIQTKILPLFRQQQFEQGIVAGTDAILATLGGTYKLDKSTAKSRNVDDNVAAVVVICTIIGFFLSLFLGRLLGGTIAAVLAAIVAITLGMALISILISAGFTFFASVSRSSGRGISSSGGGFGGGGGFSGGGGSFGGGGASGGW